MEPHIRHATERIRETPSTRMVNRESVHATNPATQGEKMLELRPYQQEAISSVYKTWHEHKRVLVVAATGTGKSIVIAKIAAAAAEKGHRVLILAHRDEIIRQNADKLKIATGHDSAIEKAGETSIGSMFPIVNGSVQTMMRDKRLNQFPKDHFKVVLGDEIHHANSNGYKKILEYFSDSYQAGFTATANMRSDKKNLGKLFDALAFEYTLKDAVDDGFLCPIKAQTMPIKVDLTSCRKKAGDFRDEDSAAAIEPYLEEMAKQVKDAAWGRKIVIFLPLIRTSLLMERLMTEQGFSCRHIDGKSKDRKEILTAFHNNEFNVLLNSALLTEGWDQPDVDTIVLCRPTQSKQLFFQIIGRGTRISPGKDHLLILDPLWITENHSFIVRPVHLVAEDDDIADRMMVMAAKGGKASLSDMEAQAHADVSTEREETLKRFIDANAHRRSKTVNPLFFSALIHDEEITDYQPTWQWEKDKATSKQIETLSKLGFDGSNLRKGYASKVLNSVMKRVDKNLASAKQVALLARFGFRKGFDTMTFKEASEKIDKLAKQGWSRKPKWVK